MRILLVVDPERKDFYNYLSRDTLNSYALLWYERSNQMRLSLNDLPINFQASYYWSQFKTPAHLISQIKPDRIVFFEIIDLRQIALIVSAKSKGIKTFYLEHGAAGDKESAQNLWLDTSLYRKTKVPYLLKRMKSIKDVIRSKYFYYSALRHLNSFDSFLKYLLLPVKMLASLPNKALMNNKFMERVPNFAITFNEANYEQFELYTGLKKTNAVLTGVPSLDKFYKYDCINENYLVYIDHPYLEGSFLNWDKDHHKKIAKSLFQFAETNNIKVYIKLHPFSDINLWYSYTYNTKYVIIIQQGEFTDIYLRAKLILGFSSSLLNGFLCAKKNVVLLGWHPKPQIFGADFSKTQLCHVSFDLRDLSSKYLYWVNHNLTIENAQAYQSFLKKYNYPFDGRATERVIETILTK